MREICQECQKPLEPENTVVVTKDFKVCKPCNEETEADWKETKDALRKQGIDPDNCNWHDRLAQKGIKNLS